MSKKKLIKNRILTEIVQTQNKKELRKEPPPMEICEEHHQEISMR